MSILLIQAFLFFIGCVLGWCLEVVYRRFKKDNIEKKWVNPGFLTGPYLPLYGFGLCALYLMANIEGTFLMSHVTVLNKIILFLFMALVMTLLEYVAGLIFIKGMKIKLWDYSNEKFNLHGIICLRFSVYWAILGAFYYFIIHPHVLAALMWFADNLAFSFFVGMFFGIFLVDFVYSLGIVTKIRAFAIENHILVRYEVLKDEIRMTSDRRKERVRFIFSFASEVPLKDHLKRYMDLQEAFDLNPVEVITGLGEDFKDAMDDKMDYIEEYIGGKIDDLMDSKEEQVRGASKNFSDGYRWNK